MHACMDACLPTLTLLRWCLNMRVVMRVFFNISPCRGLMFVPCFWILEFIFRIKHGCVRV